MTEVVWPGARRLIRMISREKKEHARIGGPRVFILFEHKNPGVSIQSKLDEPFELFSLMSSQIEITTKSNCNNVAIDLIAEAKARYEEGNKKHHDEISKRDEPVEDPKPEAPAPQAPEDEAPVSEADPCEAAMG